MIHLVIGGARSGKSRFAEARVGEFAARGYECHYFATAQGLDKEMQHRIQRHQQDRLGSEIYWHNHEVGVDLLPAIQQLTSDNRVILVDCLTLWLTGLLCEEHEEYHNESDNHSHSLISQHIDALQEALGQVPGEVILVSNEVGSGIVPLGQLSRQFVDEAGRMNQAIAAIAQKVTLVVAGLPVELKG
ncbi:bifunctional adenosylcobinamide kinase/adenosylcobinamide-phosphate guanylyltransferase [Shewanella corallii]|uniref:Bifunctional adenosylcobalamin biosynthesis protein n=1 Tax=Shewanella corallii TaxID=560080 RepID=A0ABT0NBU9_9GAMM|nr:bifunctional adenosylcobinamide kinase/adenosylcobinamide-phosphate guanylyltransferase [Shewanella corallii]MCL2915904.1 bifunctional adenosylcobinamide kinase/adenosylcobinamide-phosphate guanylyltransferase [Shewanella corallii]